MVVKKVIQQLQKIKKCNKEINAFLHVYEEQALETAKKVEEKIKNKTEGKLAGLTFGIKSCISVKKMIANCGSKTLENYTATFDADVITRIKEEDGIILGMTNMDEFAQGSSGQHSAYGPTLNPRCTDRISGGTSSGSAVAVAAQMCDVALGTDTGGSVRNPASHCGVVGIKPSYGRVSRYGVIDSAMSFDQVGVLASDVKTAATVLQVISGRSNNDPTTFDKEVQDYNETKLPTTLRIGVPNELLQLATNEDLKKLIIDRINKFAKELNIKPQHISINYVNLGVQAYYPIVYTEFFSGTRKFDGRKYGKVIEESCGEEVLRRIAGGRIISEAEHKGMYYRKALKAKQLIQEEFEKAFQIVDIILLPTTPDLPWKIDTHPDPRTEYAADAFTVLANLAGICAGVVPAGEIDGVPVGIQVMAPAFREDLLIAVLKKLESF